MMRTAPGFTLIELLIVIFIISITLGLALPQFRKTFTDMKLHTTAQDMVSLIRFAQERSAVENIMVRLNLDGAEGRYWLTMAIKDQKSTAWNFEKLGGNFGREYKIPEDLKMETEGRSIDFYPDGDMGKGRITIANTNQRSTVIVLSPGSANKIQVIENAKQ